VCDPIDARENRELSGIARVPITRAVLVQEATVPNCAAEVPVQSGLRSAGWRIDREKTQYRRGTMPEVV